MQVSLPEIIDRLSIVKLKIERIGEPHLKKEYEIYLIALKEFEKIGIKVNKKWIDKLYKINGQIWDLEWDVRKVVNFENPWKEAEEKLGFEELGRRALEVEKLMKERIEVKNEISKETGSGFEEIKIYHCGE